MGMIGNYVATDSDMLQQIENGALDLLDIDSEEHPTLDIDKSWQAIHFLLCDDIADGEPPFGYVVPMRDENALDIEMDFGAFALTSVETREAYECIKNIGEEELREKYDFQSFIDNEIYPVIDDEDMDDFFDYIYENFKSIQEFYKTASESGKGIVFYIM